ncbi:hypothetical protein AHAS_Ahas10G0109700 [Arachis hypogaea]
MYGGQGDCPICAGKQEDALHALRDCTRVTQIWVNLLNPKEIPKFFALNFEEWTQFNLFNQLNIKPNLKWKDIFIVAVWKIWSWRNREVHEQNYRRPPHPHL